MDISQAFGAYLRDHDDTGSSEACVMFAVAPRLGKRSLEATIVVWRMEDNLGWCFCKSHKAVNSQRVNLKLDRYIKQRIAASD